MSWLVYPNKVSVLKEKAARKHIGTFISGPERPQGQGPRQPALGSRCQSVSSKCTAEGYGSRAKAAEKEVPSPPAAKHIVPLFCPFGDEV